MARFVPWAMVLTGWRRQAVLRFVLTVFLSLLSFAAAAQAPEEITSAVEVRSLTAAEARQNLPVRLRGVVTFYDEAVYGRFIQDETAGIYLRESTNYPPLQAGDLVEVVGVTSPGEYAPVVVPEEVRVVGKAPLPEAKRVTFEQLASGHEDSQFVEISGVVRSAHRDATSGYHVVELATGGGRLAVLVKEIPLESPDDLVDSKVRVRGVCSTIFNRQRQLFNIRLVVPRADDFVIEVPAPVDAFEMPARPIGTLLQFTPQGSYGRRVKLVGTVSLQQLGTALFIQDEADGLNVRTRQETPLEVGDVVEVLGFPAQGVYTPILEDALYRKIRSGPAPKPDDIDHDEALKGTHDCRLVRIKARVLDRTKLPGEQSLVLDDGQLIFHAYLAKPEVADPFEHLENGSTVSVTGVCLIDPGEWQAGEDWRAASFRLLLRSASDVVVLKAPPWWTLQRLLIMIGLLAAVILLAMTWVFVLRRRVRQQTGIIRDRLKVEEELKERYLDLFENANDIVFTHDLTGRITSINRSGERLLQRDRESLLAMRLVDLVAKDQRAAAQHWLDQVVKGADLPTAEWDVLNAAGQRVKLEISSRLIEQNGKQAEVEGIARDITERRRLERELLDASNREQRRIGHDLHDGVCQQLAGIAYLVDILGDELQESHTPQAVEAEKIATLINEATVQARSVARGLFPVRLEENGLVSAIEELADSASNRFRIECTFECASPPSAVDNEVAIHLYYIAQESLVNAVNHGKASRVDVSLQPDNGRFKLVVRDNGTGFQLAGSSRSGMGIRIMQYRAKVIGATLDVNSQPGRGTEIACVFQPVRREREPTLEANHG